MLKSAERDERLPAERLHPRDGPGDAAGHRRSATSTCRSARSPASWAPSRRCSWSRLRRSTRSSPSLLTLVAGGVIGVWQGFWVAYLRVPSFIVTLAGMLLFRGATLWMLGGQPVGPFAESFRAISSGFIPEVIGTFARPVRRRRRSRSSRSARGRASSPGRRPAPAHDAAARGGRSAPCSCSSAWRARAGAGQVRVQRRRRLAPVLAAQRPDHRRHHVHRLPAGRLQGPADRRPDRVHPHRRLHVPDAADGHRAADLRGRRQRQGGDALGRQQQADGLPHLRQHGRARGARRHDHRGAASTPRRRRRATASSSTSSRRRSSAARPPTAASARSPAPSSAPCSSGC